jgi:hypothetical protein
MNKSELVPHLEYSLDRIAKSLEKTNELLSRLVLFSHLNTSVLSVTNAALNRRWGDISDPEYKAAVMAHDDAIEVVRSTLKKLELNE